MYTSVFTRCVQSCTFSNQTFKPTKRSVRWSRFYVLHLALWLSQQSCWLGRTTPIAVGGQHICTLTYAAVAEGGALLRLAHTECNVATKLHYPFAACHPLALLPYGAVTFKWPCERSHGRPVGD
jgi:hypothetical protein